MTTLRKAAQQALEALQEYQSNGAPFLACDGAVAALKAALTQQDESEMYAAAYSSACKEFRKIRDQRDALLEALKDATKTIEHLGYPLAAIERARAAIKAVEGEKA